MKVTKVDFANTGTFSNTFLDYISQKDQLTAFYDIFPNEAGFDKKLKEYTFDQSKRILLKRTLSTQYQDFAINPLVESNIRSLENDRTFTVTTGHQLNIFSGPLYFIYKIITVINLAKKLNNKYPDCHFVPVYWMATEDHDFEEINNFQLFGKKFTWTSDQKGAVGRFHPSGILAIFDQVQEQLPVFRKAYSEHATLSLATRYFVNEIFGEEGLLILDADCKDLKYLFKEVIRDELINQTSARIVGETSSKLENLGYKTQVNPREINIFFLDDQIRERIIKEDNIYRINNTEMRFSEEEILKLVESSPEKFSPNVLLRPLYEEIVLPNLCYTGGPAEIVYWLQLKSLFNHYTIPFPILLPRNFVLYINKSLAKKLMKFPIQQEDLFLKDDRLVSQFLTVSSEEHYQLDSEKEVADDIFKEISKKAEIIDRSLVGYVLSEKQKALKQIEDIEKKLKKAEQKKSADDIAQLIALKVKLFPDNSLQERKENLLSFSINDPAFLSKIMGSLDPLEFSFHIISEDPS